VIEWDDYVEQTNNGRCLIAIAGIVYDVIDFAAHHPGGNAVIRGGIGKDATAMFNGGIYNHSNAANNLLSTMRVSFVRGGGNVAVWRKVRERMEDSRD
jgi:stearoyl-CoA desaturase (Delta-9 desaturase)